MVVPSNPEDYDLLDIPSALEQTGDAQTMHGLLTMLEESLTRDIRKIAELLVAGDVRGANRVLHALKGVVPIFCVPSLCQQVTRVEELSKTGAVAQVSDAYFTLMPDLEQLQSQVSMYLTEYGS